MSGTLELRRALPADAGAVRDLTRQAYAKWVPLIGREPKPMTADYELAVRRHRFDLLSSNGQLAALRDCRRRRAVADREPCSRTQLPTARIRPVFIGSCGRT